MFSYNWFNIFNPFRGIYGYTFFYFCIGGIAHDIKSRVKIVSQYKLNVIAIISLFCSFASLFLIGLNLSIICDNMWDVVWNGYDTIPTLIDVLSIFVLSLSFKKSYPFIRYISCNTLGIYFTHEIFIHLLRNYIRSFSFFSSFIGSFIFAIFVLLISLTIVCMIKKTPILNKILML